MLWRLARAALEGTRLGHLPIIGCRSCRLVACRVPKPDSNRAAVPGRRRELLTLTAT
jgi:hypothetical protein